MSKSIHGHNMIIISKINCNTVVLPFTLLSKNRQRNNRKVSSSRQVSQRRAPTNRWRNHHDLVAERPMIAREDRKAPPYYCLSN